MKLTESNLEKVNDRLSEIIHIQQEHLTITKALSKRTTEAHDELVNLTYEFLETVGEIKTRVTNAENAIAKLERSLNLVENITAKLQQLELTTFKALLDVRSLVHSVEMLVSGKLSVNLISPVELSKILSKVRESLPLGTDFISGISVAEVYKYYQYARVRAVADSYSIKVWLDLPLASVGRNFELFQVRSLPTRDSTTGAYVIYHPEEQHILVNVDRSTYSILQFEDLAECVGGDPMVCPVRFPLFQSHHHTCISTLFFEDMTNSQKLCTRSVIIHPPSPTWVWDGTKKKWLYSLPEQATLVSQCQNGDRTVVTEMTVNNIGEVDASKSCQLRTRDYVLLPNTERKNSIEIQQRVVKIEAPTPIQLDVELKQPKNELQVLFTEARGRGLVTRFHPSREEITIEELQELNQRLHQDQLRTTTIIYSGCSVIFIIILVVILLLVVHVLRRSRQRLSTANPRDSHLSFGESPSPDEQTGATAMTTLSAERPAHVVYRLAPSEVKDLRRKATQSQV